MGSEVDIASDPWRRNLCVEHIWNRKGPASEHWSNYATVGEVAHRWKHRCSVEARIGISWFKWNLAKETGDWRHFDLEALKAASGFYVPGWIETKLETVELPAWCWQMGKELVEGF